MTARALYVPALATGGAGASYIAWRQWTLSRPRRRD